MYTKLIERIKSEKILLTVIFLAVLSCFFVNSDKITDKIDTSTIGIFFSAMAVAAGLNDNGVFDKLSGIFTNGLKTTRSAALAVVLLTFFSAPFITDIAAVMIFSSLTVLLFRSEPQILMYVLSLQTAAANIGCIIFPSASAVNLFIFTKFTLSYRMYITVALPLYLFSFALLLIMTMFTKNKPLPKVSVPAGKIESRSYIAIYFTLLLLDLFAVTGVIDMLTVFISVCLVLAIMDPQIFSKIDYSVLILLTALYIFRGNLLSVREAVDFMSGFLNGHFAEADILLSQLTGNLTSTAVVSVFGGKAREYIFSANTAGFLSVYASYTGVFTKRLCAEKLGEDSVGKYIMVYTSVGAVFTAVLYIFFRLISPSYYF